MVSLAKRRQDNRRNLAEINRLRQAVSLLHNKLEAKHADPRWLLAFTLWLFNIAMENGPSIDGLPIKNGDFP